MYPKNNNSKPKFRNHMLDKEPNEEELALFQIKGDYTKWQNMMKELYKTSKLAKRSIPKPDNAYTLNRIMEQIMYFDKTYDELDENMWAKKWNPENSQVYKALTITNKHLCFEFLTKSLFGFPSTFENDQIKEEKDFSKLFRKIEKLQNEVRKEQTKTKQKQKEIRELKDDLQETKESLNECVENCMSLDKENELLKEAVSSNNEKEDIFKLKQQINEEIMMRKNYKQEITKINKENEEWKEKFKCIICLDQMKEVQMMVNCGHVSCPGCLEQWMTNSTKCPMCDNYIQSTVKMFFS